MSTIETDQTNTHLLKRIAKDWLLSKSVIGGVIAGLLVIYFIEPVIHFTWSSITNTSNAYVAGMIDNAYRDAAVRNPHRFSFIIYSNLSTLIFCAMIIAPSGLMMAHLQLKKRFKKITGSNDSVENEEADISEEINSVRKLLITMDRYVLPVMFLSCAIMALLVIKSMFHSYIVFQTTASFNQRLSAISPYISDQEEEELASQWALMVSRSDYENINHRLESFASKNNKSLPDLLLE